MRFCIRVVPMEVFICVMVVSIFGVGGCGSFHPSVCTGFVFVLTVWVAVTDIVSVLGAIMRYLQPFASSVVSVDDLLVRDGSSSATGTCCGYCVCK